MTFYLAQLGSPAVALVNLSHKVAEVPRLPPPPASSLTYGTYVMMILFGKTIIIFFSRKYQD